MASERTEKATPKKLEDARKKGQVARSADLGGAATLVAGLIALSAFGPKVAESLASVMRHVLALVATPEVVGEETIGNLLTSITWATVVPVAPILMACAAGAILANVGQVGLKITPDAIKPQLTRINPLKGAKQIFGPNLLFETGKSISKVAVVAVIAGIAVFPKLSDLASLVGLPAAALAPQLAHTVLAIARRAAIAYLVIGAADYLWQRRRHLRSLRMDKQEVKDEFKQQTLSSEVRGAQRRRALELARARMMADVPTADVVVTNPTHYAVALRYDGKNPAPVVVAKGMDHIALKIREVAEASGVAIVPNPPLARALHSAGEVGHAIPEALYEAVAQLLAFVYRTARKKIAA